MHNSTNKELHNTKRDTYCVWSRHHKNNKVYGETQNVHMYYFHNLMKQLLLLKVNCSVGLSDDSKK